MLKVWVASCNWCFLNKYILHVTASMIVLWHCMFSLFQVNVLLQYSTIQYTTVQYSIQQYSNTAQHSSVEHSAAQYNNTT